MAAIVAVATAAASLLLVVAAWRAGPARTSLAWIPSWGPRFDLTFDGLAAVYGLLATGIGLVVVIYSSAYIPAHLEHQGRDASEATTFYALILLFMGAMVGLVVADDLMLLFVFWDLTAVVSYFLIGFDREEPLARPAALMALLVTGGSAILMLAGIVMLWLSHGTTSVQTIVGGVTDGREFTIAVSLIVVAALAKSAQVPLHFWLPRAMVAPTPVSSYLHSAAMVAAGVFLLARILPMVHRAELLPQALVVVGVVSIAAGGILAVGRDDMKQLLAYSTIGQYGYVVVMLGLGGVYGAVGAAFYVMAHGMAKCALFLTAGAVTEATGRRRLSELGGLLRQMPVLGVASGVAAATLAALPLTIGFFKDELFFAAMHEQGPALTAIALAAAALTFAYVGRFWTSIFLGPAKAARRALPVRMTGAVVALAALCAAGGVWAEPANALANAAGGASLLMPASVDLAYHVDARPENFMALAAYALGLGLLGSVRWWSAASRRLALWAERFGPDRVYRGLLDAVNTLSDRLHDYEVHDLRGRIAWVLVPVGVLVGLGLLTTSNEGAFLPGRVTTDDLLLILVLFVVSGAAMTTATVSGHLAAALMLSTVGFPLAAVYAFLGAPDVALVAVLMETMLALLFIGFLAAMRDRPPVEGFDRDPEKSYRNRDIFVGLVSTGAAFVLVWGVLSKPAAIESSARDQIALTPSAHAGDVVSAILADFRGLDTMGEITVIAIAMIGLLALMQRPWQRR